jgi:regulatory protein
VSERPRSLESRALACLARREFSRAELRARLAPHAESAEALEAVLDKLALRKLLSEERFVESLVRRRSARFGSARIRQELRSHQVDAAQVREVVHALDATEFERAREVWRKRFREPAASREERLKQMRFLAARGFAVEVIRRVVGVGAAADPEES